MPKRKYSGGPASSAKRVRSRKIYRAKRRAKAKARVTTHIRSIGPIPPRAIVKMKYAHEQAIPTGALAFTYGMNLNSTYEPDRVAGVLGHQPYGRDTYFALYNRYRVFAAKFKVTFVAPEAAAVFCGVFASNNVGPMLNQTLFQETPGALTRTFQGGATTCVLKGRRTLSKIVGVPPSTYKADDRYQSQAGTNPLEAIVLHIIYGDAAGGARPAGVMRIEMVYYVEWFDQLELGQS